MTDKEKIEQFLATKGATVVPMGQKSMSRNEMRAAVRGEGPKPKTEDELIQERHLQAVDHMGREHWVNGLGETISFG